MAYYSNIYEYLKIR